MPFCGKVRIARGDSASMFPGAKGIAAEPVPQGSAADLSYQALGNNVLADFLNREPRQLELEGIRKLAGECLNLNDETGEKAGLRPPRGCRPDYVSLRGYLSVAVLFLKCLNHRLVHGIKRVDRSEQHLKESDERSKSSAK